MLQDALNVIIGLFQRYGLVANVTKYKAMTCQPGTLWSGMLEKAVGWWCTGSGSMYQKQPITRIPCLNCGVELTAVSITVHMCWMHGTEP